MSVHQNADSDTLTEGSSWQACAGMLMLMVVAGIYIDTRSSHKPCTSHSIATMARTCLYEQMCGGVLYYFSISALHLGPAQSVSKDAHKMPQCMVHAVVLDVQCQSDGSQRQF